MKLRLRHMCRYRLLAVSLGTLWIGGCVTDAQLRDFVTSTAISTFWQSVATWLQAAIVSA